MRTARVRAEIQRLMNQRPFRHFALLLENGDRVIIEHPENIAFDPTATGVAEFYVIAGQLRLFSTFEAVSGVTLLDAEGDTGAA